MPVAFTVFLSVVAFVKTAVLWEGASYAMHRWVMHGAGRFSSRGAAASSA